MTKYSRETEHFTHRNFSLHVEENPFFNSTYNHSASLIQGPEDVPLKLRRPFHRNLHNRLHNNRLGLGVGTPESLKCCCLKSHFRGVNSVKLSIVQYHSYPYNREPDQTTLFQGSLESGITGRNVFCGNHTTLYLVHKLVVFFAFCNRLDSTDHPSKLSGPTSLLFVGVVIISRLTDGFTVGYLGYSHIYLSLVFPLHTGNVYIKVKLTHTLYDGLVRLGINVCSESRVLLGKAVQGLRHTVRRALVLR